MQFVASPQLYPHECAVSLRSEDAREFIDTEMTLTSFEPRVYVSISALEEMGRLAGMLPQADAKALHAELDAARERITELESQLAEAQAVVAAIDVIESADFQRRRKAGRKPRSEVAA